MDQRTFSVVAFLGFVSGCADYESAEVNASPLGEANQLDPRFGDQGTVRAEKLAKGATSAAAYDLADRLLVASADPTSLSLEVRRYSKDGRIDPGYRQRSKIKLELPPEGASLSMQPMADGSAIVSVSALCVHASCPFDYEQPGRVTRYLLKVRANGDLDTSFGGGRGFVSFDSPQRRDSLSTYAFEIARTREGGLVAALDQPADSVEVVWLSGAGDVQSKHRAEGLHGRTFSLAVAGTTAVLGRSGYEDDRHFGYVVGVERTTGRLVRGAGPWTAYDPHGAMIQRVIATDTDVWALGRADTDPFETQRVAIHKLKHDLLVDPSFGTAGTRTFDAGSGAGGELNDLRVLPDGRILAIGTIEADGIFQMGKGDQPTLKLGSDHQFAYIMLKPNGALDRSFAEHGIFLLNAGEKDDRLVALSRGSSEVFAVGYSGRTPVMSKLFFR